VVVFLALRISFLPFAESPKIKINPNLIYEEETYKIRRTCFEVYREKGCGRAGLGADDSWNPG
jgi:hypothetical protein